MFNNAADILGLVLSGTLGRSGRKRARRATRFLTGHAGFLSASTIIGAAGVAWGIYDTLKNQATAVPGVPTVPQVPGEPLPPIPAAVQNAIDPVVRVIQLAVSAARADGTLSEQERAVILDRARQAGLESLVEAELNQARPLAEIVKDVTDPQVKHELYVLAFTIVRADESVSGAERIYLAQLASYLGLEAAEVKKIEDDAASKIDAQPEH